MFTLYLIPHHSQLSEDCLGSSVQCSQYTEHTTLHTIHSAHYTAHTTVPIALCTGHCSLCSVHFMVVNTGHLTPDNLHSIGCGGELGIEWTQHHLWWGIILNSEHITALYCTKALLSALGTLQTEHGTALHWASTDKEIKTKAHLASHNPYNMS